MIGIHTNKDNAKRKEKTLVLTSPHDMPRHHEYARDHMQEKWISNKCM